MIPWRRLTSMLAAVLAPLALGVLVMGVPMAAASSGCGEAVAAAPMPGCEHAGAPDHGKSAPARSPDCAKDCPLLCAPIASGRLTIEQLVRPYARLRFEVALSRPEGLALDPQHPPPRSLQT
jgi:hypothetical protein